MKRFVLSFFSLMALITACNKSTSDEIEQIESESTLIPIVESTTTDVHSIEPTDTFTPLLPKIIPTLDPELKIDFVVTFDGKDCVAEGPTEVLPGDYGFKFIDTSDVRGELWLLYLDEGKTIQDELDLQSEPGEWYPKPTWVHYGEKISKKYERTDEGKIEISLMDLKLLKEYTIMCYVNSPRKLWFVAPIYVVETLSE